MKSNEQQLPADPPPDRGDTEPPSSFEIAVADCQSSMVAPVACLEAAVKQVLTDARIAAAAISVAVVDDATIRQLNRRHLEHDYETDVLSYPLSRPGDSLEGEIVISTETALRNAAEAGWEATAELTLYVIHGALHLVGYGDKAPADAAAMRRAEAAVLDRLGMARSTRDARWSKSLAAPTEVGESTTL